MRKSVLGHDPLARLEKEEAPKNAKKPRAKKRPTKPSAAAETSPVESAPVVTPPQLSPPHAPANSEIDDTGAHTPSPGRLSGWLRKAVGLVTSEALDPFGADPQLSGKAHTVLGLLSTLYWRVSVENVGVIPERPCIFVCNHGGAIPLDGPLLAEAVRRERPLAAPVRWLLEDDVFTSPVLGRLLNRLGAVRSTRDNALRLLASGQSVAVFPEGAAALSKPHNAAYQLGSFGRGGYLRIALEHGCHVIPVGILGAEATSPTLGRLPATFWKNAYVPLTVPPLPAKWRIRFGEALDVAAALGASQKPDEVSQLNEHVRTRLQAMLDDLNVAS